MEENVNVVTLVLARNYTDKAIASATSTASGVVCVEEYPSEGEDGVLYVNTNDKEEAVYDSNTGSWTVVASAVSSIEEKDIIALFTGGD